MADRSSKCSQRTKAGGSQKRGKGSSKVRHGGKTETRLESYRDGKSDILPG